MHKKILKPILLSTLSIVLIAGCASTGMPTIKNADGSTNNTQTAAVIGGLLGAVIGGTTANRGGKRVAIGGAIGAGVGAIIGYNMDQQAQEVAQVLNTNVNNVLLKRIQIIRLLFQIPISLSKLCFVIL